LGQFVAEFAINNAWQESIGDTPFFLSFGQHPQTLLTWTGAGESASKIPAVTQFVGRFSESLSAAKRDLQVAEQRQKACADMHRSSQSFSVGDHVLLSSRNLKLKKAPAGARKLMPRWLGPFPVVDEVGTVAYRLELPASMRFHPVFHLDDKTHDGTSLTSMIRFTTRPTSCCTPSCQSELRAREHVIENPT
jgi:hypothetical protein